MPVILVAGDEALMKEVSQATERLALKSAVSRYAAESKSLRLIKKELTYACARALERFRMGAINPMKAKEPIKIEMRFTHRER